ncbi:hypothetical protein EVAR_18845_1 [Eumeta japonica]|uniref:Uncharacterized protein n=1 Tax=Eumeta variegata TaxID=151549 RepID=A0A4C1ULP9_EUMVA|nr:hypothetical protein EVAR_18845_1 [Eumeta japonica]
MILQLSQNTGFYGRDSYKRAVSTRISVRLIEGGIRGAVAGRGTNLRPRYQHALTAICSMSGKQRGSRDKNRPFIQQRAGPRPSLGLRVVGRARLPGGAGG